jgi:hypothetical protein
LQADEYLNHYRGCIRIYTGAAKALEKRIAEANVGTSAKSDAILAEPKTTKDKPETKEVLETKDNKSSSNEKWMEVPGTEESETETDEDKTESEEGETEDSESLNVGTDLTRKGKERNSNVKRY